MGLKEEWVILFNVSRLKERERIPLYPNFNTAFLLRDCFAAG
ncbi:MAG: hypothetical protein ACTSYC_05060 [Promethearchaeota archaeon]